MHRTKHVPKQQEIDDALANGNFIPIRLLHDANFHGRPWLLLSVFPELDSEIRALNKLYDRAAGIRLMGVLAFHEATDGPVIPFVKYPAGKQHPLPMDVGTLANITSLIEAVARGLEIKSSAKPSAPANHVESQDGDGPVVAEGGILDQQPDCDSPVSSNVVVVAIESRSDAADSISDANTIAQAEFAMISALEMAHRYGLTDKVVIGVVESLARHQGSGSRLLLPTETGTKEIDLPSLAKLRGVKRRSEANPVVYAGEVTGFDRSNGVVIVDGKFAVSGYCDIDHPVPIIGDILRFNGISRGKLILEKILPTADPRQIEIPLAEVDG